MKKKSKAKEVEGADKGESIRAAARDGAEEELRILLCEHGCDVSYEGKDGMTPLMWAAYNGHEACISLLLPVSDTEARDSAGMTALMWAAYDAHCTSVSLLLSVSNALSQNHEGETALICAAKKGSAECIEILLPMSDPFAKDKYGSSASDWARTVGLKSSAQRIDAYALAQSEKEALGAAMSLGTLRRKATRRV